MLVNSIRIVFLVHHLVPSEKYLLFQALDKWSTHSKTLIKEQQNKHRIRI